MSLLDKIYKSSIFHYIPKYFLRKLKKKFNYYFVEIHLDKLPKKNYPSAITFKGQEDLMINFKSKDYIPRTNCLHLIQILKLIFVDNSKWKLKTAPMTDSSVINKMDPIEDK